MNPSTLAREQARWKTVGRLQGRIQALYGGHCYIGASPIHGTEASGTVLWTVKWGTTGLQAHCNPFRHVWAHYPHASYASVPDMLYDLLCTLNEKLRAAEVERARHGYGTLKQMALQDHQRLLLPPNAES